MEFAQGSPPVDGEPPPRPEWFGPPEDAVGAILALDRILLRREDVGIALTHATAYPTGCLLHLRFAVHRSDAQDKVQGRPHLGRRPEPFQLDPDGLHFDIRYPDGNQVGTRRHAVADVVADYRAQRQRRTPMLMHWGGSSGGTGAHWTGDRQLWLYPLPQPDVLELTWQWSGLEVPSGQTELDGTAILAAAQRAFTLLG